MLSETQTIYKFIVLYMLNNVSFPLSNNEISKFILNRGYTDYITLQSAIGELKDNELIEDKTVRNRTLYEITEEGRQTINFFPTELSEELKKDIIEYLKENEHELRQEISVMSDYKKLPNGEYKATGWITEDNEKMVEVSLTVPTEKMALDICLNWKKKNEEIYKYLTGQLF